MILTAIYAIFMFCLLIFVHEFGHFSTAKLVGIRVNEFSIGMGPRFLHFTKGETEYSLRAFPIGGYVKMEGEDEDSEDERAFHNTPVWARGLVLVAGSFMNLLTAVVIVTIMVLTIGVASTTIGEVSEGMPAERAGIEAGDRIVAVDGTNVSDWNEITDEIEEAEKGPIEITVERDGERKVFVCTPEKAEDGRSVIGIRTQVRHDPGSSLQTGVACILQWGGMMLDFLVELFTGHGSVDDLMGPVGIVSLINDQAKVGFLYVANLMALISLNLAIINMLPLPALDGGRVLFLIIRCFTGEAISDELEAKIHFVGLMFFFALMIFLVYKDIGRLLQ